MPSTMTDRKIPPLVEQDSTISQPSPLPAASESETEKTNIFTLVRSVLKGRSDLRETIEEYIDDANDGDHSAADAHERALLANILKLRDIRVHNIMVPRASIVAIEIGTTQEQLLSLLAEKQFSRIPVYRDTLDDVLGTIHIKDVVAALARGQSINIRDLITDIPIVSPALPVLDLLLKMRHSRRHMVLVVDEFGGIDGLVTIGDLTEFIVGEIADEHHVEERPAIIEKPDGSIIADALTPLEDFESRFGACFSTEDHDGSDTLAGLVFALAGRVPVRGEVITHACGMTFEVMEADPRRVYRLRIRNIPAHTPA